MRKMRILVIGPGMQIGGVERSLLGLLDAFDYSCVEVDLFLRSHDGELMPLINQNVNLLPEYKPLTLATWPISKLFRSGHFGIGTTRLLSKIRGDIRGRMTGSSSVNTHLCNKFLVRRMPKLERHYDLALGFFWPFYGLESKVDAEVKVGWVHTDYSNVNEKLDVDFYREMWGSLDYVACVSEGVRASFAKVYPELKERMIVVENILSGAMIASQASEFDVTEEMPNDGKLKILSVGRFAPPKGFDEAIRACKILHDQGYGFRWYFIGYGPDEQMLESLVAELDCADYVRILGKKANPYPYIAACDLYAQPSRYEGKAVTVRESQMLHKPVMITRYETSASQLEEGVDGYICEMGIQGIVDGVSRLISDSDLRQRLVTGTYSRSYDNAYVAGKIAKLRRLDG